MATRTGTRLMSSQTICALARPTNGPPLILAHLARGTWPARVREAWRVLQSAKGLTELDLGVQLLIACRDIFAQDPREHWSPTELRGKLIADESAIWAEMPKTGKPLSTNMMARLLKRHGIQITEKRTGTSNARIDRPRGYRVTDFREPFARQLRPGRIPEDLVTSDSDVATSGSAPEERSDPLETWVSSENTGPSASEWRDSGTTVTPQGLSAFQMAGQAEDLSRQLEPEKPNIFSDVPLSRHLGRGRPVWSRTAPTAVMRAKRNRLYLLANHLAGGSFDSPLAAGSGRGPGHSPLRVTASRGGSGCAVAECCRAMVQPHPRSS